MLSTKLWALSERLKSLNFEQDMDLAVMTNVTHEKDLVVASPLTWLPGNTRGTQPREDPEGWAHAVKLDTDRDTGKRKSMWVRGHLLSQRLHGPGVKWNLVPFTQKTNADMKGPESDAAAEISKKGTILEYRVGVTFHENQSAPVKYFPDKIQVKWRKLQPHRSNNRLSYPEKEKGAWKPYGFTQGAPPAKVKSVLLNINDLGRPELIRLTGVSDRFGLAFLAELGEGRFTNFKNLMGRMLKNQTDKMTAETLQDHLGLIKAAENKTIKIEP
jgi:hypothetical protein